MTRQFYFSPTGAALTAVLVGLMLALGFWQLDRAEQKRQTLAAFEQSKQLAAPYVVGAGTPGQYAPIELEGQYLSDRQIILDGLAHDRLPGYQVLTPFRLQDSEVIVMINRGWRVWSGPRQGITDIDVGSQPRTLSGRADRFWRPGLVLGQGNEAERTEWPRLSIYPQAVDMARWLDANVMPWQLLLDADQPDGFVRDWRPTGLSPQRHVGYAMQWFALCLTLVILYISASFKKVPAGTGPDT